MSVKGTDIVNDLLAQGWQRNPEKPGEIFDPTNRELTVWVDPNTDQPLFSPTLIASLREKLEGIVKPLDNA